MSLAEFSLEGKKALVVGARRNMGKGFALGLAEAGADVAVTDINVEDGRLHEVRDSIQAMGAGPSPFRRTSRESPKWRRSSKPSSTGRFECIS